MSKNISEESKTSTIAAGVEIVGEIKANGNIRIDGTVKGNITLTGKLVVVNTGVIEGDVMCKNFLNAVLNETLEPIRTRRKELEQDIPYVYEVLRKGSEVARAAAAETLAAVKRSMKINYFEPGVLAELIREQSEKYRNS